MGCINERFLAVRTNYQSDTEKTNHMRRRYQHLIQNLVNIEFHKSIDKVYNIDSGKILGTGISGIVRSIKHLETGELYAMKTLSLSRNKVNFDNIWEEVQIMSEMDHPNIVRLHEIFETDDNLYLIMELCTGGELLDRLHKQDRHCFNEMEVIPMVKTMIEVVKFCHDHHIVHRDLKLENFLFENNEPDAELKLIDFGLSRYYHDYTKMTRPVGTPYYVAPEVLNGSYTRDCDMWSMGVITYMLVSGRPPFYGKDDHETLQKVRSGIFDFSAPSFDFVSDIAKDFISKLLQKDTAHRLSACDALKHPWLNNSRKIYLSNHILSSLKMFYGYCTLKRIILKIIASFLKDKDMKVLRDEFKHFYRSESILQKFGLRLNFNILSWHEFLAATLSSESITDDHIRIAFDRIDYTGAGFINRENLSEFVGRDMTAEEIDFIFEELGLFNIDFNTFSSIIKCGDRFKR